MVYIGIDPGKSGAIAYIEDDMIVTALFDEVVYKKILESIKGKRAVCCLERVGAMPGQGVNSMFHFGENYGFIRGLLEANEIPYQVVRPQDWKREFGVTKDKNTSIEVCKRLFPQVSLLPTERSRKDNDGIAEAVLMACYAQRRL